MGRRTVNEHIAVARPVSKAVDFNRILMWLNFIVFVAMLGAYAQFGDNDYITGSTIWAASILSLQTHVALLIERRRRDPFVILLTFVLVLYYSLRIVTLTAFPFSFVLPRFEYAPTDSTFALVVILIGNAFLYAGFYAVRSRGKSILDGAAWRGKAPRRTIGLVAVTILFIYSRGILWDPGSIPHVFQFLLIFASQSSVLLMALVYYLLIRKSLSVGASATLIGLLVLEMLLHSLAGSRSAFIGVVQNVLFVLLAIHGTVSISRRLVSLGVVLLPLAVATLVVTFLVSTFVRAATETESSFSISTALDLSRNASERIGTAYALQAGLQTMFARAGFFDYSADLIAHRREYAPIINAAAYTRSIVDNILTPGFDVFDQPRISNAMRFAYEERGNVSKIASAGAYQSDQLGIYGEFFLLASYAAFPLMFVVAWLFKRVYVSFDDDDPYTITIKRVVTLSLFVETVNSFGIDWILMDTITLIAAVYIYRWFFAVVPQEAISKA